MHSPELVLAFGIGSWEWLIILLVALLLFGRRLPDIMRGLGSSVKEFKKGMDDGPAPPAPSAPPAPPAAPSGAVPRDPVPAQPPPAAPPAPTDPHQPPKA